MFDIQHIHIKKLKKLLYYTRDFNQIVYICINMSTPLPVRSARLEWTFYFPKHE